MATDVQVRPDDINLQTTLRDTFGKWEAELAATIIVVFCRDRRGWVKFSSEDITRLAPGRDGILAQVGLEILVEKRWITKVEGDLLQVTPAFIERCHEKHPVIARA
ncbi:hypothetical protein A2716_00790 [candidate division WWE3 bacterium RIFCSPHIGHO2_01_FULL_40_23]|uniref:Uncharacterized protein n=1 Tax=candidate division WWE3 bacterium RIFCSPLOWO2_01_FULL_41_18 TaxID=1802625 RepID=A0A1F4VEZ0_UNCKA|nr:MAG: hypothetical protein A2716_00790 [candidate division WWE3 bacterium RIFCSPHIGHO2_01_FULL_40_23]OGC55528.1 MAG: hypothetical protein A3A78_01060 [candidate division WWE3 bacterium RIFCSPLOWO2_01_FULL_41_18]